MVAPTIGTPGTVSAGTGTARTPGAPGSVTNGTMVLGIMGVASVADPTEAANFTLKYVTSGKNPAAIVQWRRNTGGAEPSYSWPTDANLSQSYAIAFPVENEENDSDPFHTSSDLQTTASIASAYLATSMTSVPAGATLVWVGVAAADRSVNTAPVVNGTTSMSRMTAAAAQLVHAFKIENFAGGSVSVGTVASTGGTTRLTSMLFAILPSSDVSTGSATGSWSAAGTASGIGGAHTGSATGGANFFGTAEGPNPVSEYVEDWADLASVTATGVQVSGNRLYSSGSTSPRGYLKIMDIPPTGIWRYQQVVYCQGGSTTPAPTIKLGVTTNPSPTTISDTDSYAVGWQIQFSTRARSSFKGGNLSAVPILDEEIAGLSIGTTTSTYLFTIDADEHFISFALKNPATTQDLAVFRLSRADLADAGREITAIYAYITDGRGTSGSSLSPFIYQTGSLQPTATKVVAGQTIEGHAQHFIATAEETGSVRDWYFALPPNYQPTSPLLIHCPQSLTGDGDDFWTDSRMGGVTAALTAAGFVLASSSDVADRFANEVDVQNFASVKEWFFDHFGGDRDVFLFGTSMGTLSDVVLVARGLIDARAIATIGFAGGQFWIWYNVTSKRDALRTAFGFSGTPTDSQLHDYFEGYDPQYDYAGDTDFAGKGFRFYTSDSDTVTPSSLSDGMSAIVQAAGASEYTVIRASGGHLDPSQYQPTDLVDFYLRNASESTGTATGAWSATGTSSGIRSSIGAATGTWQASGSAAGSIQRHGSATSAWSAAGTADGERDAGGSTTGAWSAAGTASGGIQKAGSATGAWEASGTATGRTQDRGSASGSWSVSGTATGGVVKTGSATGAWSASGSASGQRVPTGQVSGGWEASGSADGYSGGSGFGIGSWSAPGTASGIKAPLGFVIGTWSANGSASGLTTRQGSATGSWSAAGSGSGESGSGGSATGSWSVSGSTQGQCTPKGQASGAWAAAGIASGGIPKMGSATGSWAAAGDATGRKATKGITVGNWIISGTATGAASSRFGSATGSWEASGSARSKLPVPSDPVATIIPKRSVAEIVTAT